MKKIIYTIMAVMMMASFAYAGAVQDNVGKCGMGSQIWGNRDGFFAHFFAMTTNNSSGSNTYGTTSGTSGCDTFSGLVYNEKVDTFIANNMSNLAQDIARGEGEYLDTLSSLMDVKDSEKVAFNKALKENYNDIYSSSDVTSQEVTEKIKVIVTKNEING